MLQLTKLSMPAVRRYVQYQLDCNERANERPETAPFRWRRSHHQLPCSQETRKRRAQLFEELGFRHRSVCLLGDDDRISLELIERGFTDITVYECDADLLRELSRSVPTSSRSAVRFIQADVSEIARLERGFADLVVFDPPYNTDGLNVFARAALHCASTDPGTRIILMTVPLLFENRNQDWRRLKESFAARNLHLDEHRPGFNAYPIDALGPWVLLGSSCLLGVKRPRRPLREWKFFSDCLGFLTR